MSENETTAVDVLKKIEWSLERWDGKHGGTSFACPSCRRRQEVGHAFDCELLAALSPPPVYAAGLSEDEKRRRVYYQNIVYDVCNIIDRFFQVGTVCGTVDEPTTEVQDRLRDRVAPLITEQRSKRGDVGYWVWQGDDSDHLESLTCPVLIGADELRSLNTRDAQSAKQGVVVRREDDLWKAFEALANAMDGHPWYCISYGEKCYAYAVIEACPFDEGKPYPTPGQWLKPHEGDDRNLYVASDGTVMMAMDTVCANEDQCGYDVCDFIAKARATLAEAALAGVKEGASE